MKKTSSILLVLLVFCAVAFGVLFVMNQINLMKPDDTPQHTHTAGSPVIEKEVAATCTTDGSYDSVVYCTECKEEVSRETKTVNKLGHTPKEAVTENKVDATCTTDGSYEAVVYCGTCEEEISRVPTVIEAQGHDYESVVTAPTCTAKGYTTHTCSVCSDSYTDSETAETGHSYTSEVTAPTCTAGGYTTYTCSVCGDSYTDSATDATGHTNGTPVTEKEIAATCSAEGSYDSVVYCEVCGDEISRVTNTVEKLAHTPKEAVTENKVDATCSAEGSYDSVVYCDVCDEELSRVTETVEMLEHTPGGGVVENKIDATAEAHGTCDMVVYCKDCGTKISTNTITLHYFEEDSVYCSIEDCGVSNVLEYDNFDETNGTCEVTGVKSGETAPTNLIIPNSYIDGEGNIYRVRGVGESAFLGYSITTVEISEGIESIGRQAFQSCNSLTTVVINEGVETIGVKTFYATPFLVSVKLPDSIKIISNQSFTRSKITELYIGSNVTEIQKNAFYDCGTLSTIYYNGTKEEFDEISVGASNNEDFFDATKYYYSESEPTEAGNYWHYVDGVITEWPAVVA